MKYVLFTFCALAAGFFLFFAGTPPVKASVENTVNLDFLHMPPGG